jgi:hypothetical protein
MAKIQLTNKHKVVSPRAFPTISDTLTYRYLLRSNVVRDTNIRRVLGEVIEGG